MLKTTLRRLAKQSSSLLSYKNELVSNYENTLGNALGEDPTVLPGLYLLFCFDNILQVRMSNDMSAIMVTLPWERFRPDHRILYALGA